MTRLTADWLTQAPTRAVCAALSRDGAQVLFVGGCVRNTLLEVPVSDLDIATDARPETVMKLAAEAGLRAVPTGIEHGTVTVIADGHPFEVTTFRHDIETDGRRAVVSFATDMAEDAMRRDFTMNALYARPDGCVLDPVGGLPDLIARRVRFIGDAHDRIREDHLRSLRFFRFHAWYGDPAAGMDPDALAAIAAHLDGLDRLSRERIGAEMLKLLAARDPAPAVAAMRQCGVLAAILPGTDDRALAPVVHFGGQLGLGPDPILRLAALGPDFTDALRLSRDQARRLDLLRRWAEGAAPGPELGYRLGAEDALAVIALRAALTESPPPPDAVAGVASGAGRTMPLGAADLMPQWRGAALGERLRDLEDRWIASGFTLTRDRLLALPRDPEKG
ncbi:MAG: CCA tRNA nucleotidyltransferase [Rhodobacteraceae bacterium]|nr:MAG: CCA tRNA nucleotidyltransferase [Paracoccaceae bacterium]